MTAAFLLSRKAVRGSQSLQKPWPCAGNFCKMRTEVHSVLAGISFFRSCSWHSGPPKDDSNEVLFSRLNNHANVSSSLRGLNIFNKILLIQIKQVS